MSNEISTAIEMITAERQRQIDVEGWSPAHDDAHDDEEMASAAACYCQPTDLERICEGGSTPQWWPWAPAWWKPAPNDRVRELVKAGALIVAEIERLQRKEA